jgi:hypothetical protein
MADSMRSLNSFGVAGLLGANAEIFYSNDLRARNIGRISDLVSAKFREKEADEMRLRVSMAYGLFLAYAVRGLEFRHTEEMPPVAVEIGFDGSYVAVGIAFQWEGSRAPKFEGMVQRISGEQPGDTFERILTRLDSLVTQSLVRYELKAKRIEIVALINRNDANMKDPFQVVAIDPNTAPLLEVASYVELGDLDYTKLLKTSTLADDIDAKEDAVSDALVDGRSPQATLEEIKIGGSTVAPVEQELHVVGEKLGDREEEFRFIGNSPEVEAEELRAMVADYERTVGELRGTVHELQGKLDEALTAKSERHFTKEAAVAEEPITVVKAAAAPEKKEDDWGVHFLKQVWPFAPKTEEKVVVKAAADPEVDAVETVIPPDAPLALDPAPASEAENASNQALLDLQALADQKKSKKVEETLKEISEQVEEKKARKWVDNLSSELLQEKARLAELQKNLAKQIRQRELEFKTAELSLKQELKRKEEILRQKESALVSKGDQIAQLNLAIERAGTATADKEQSQMKSKLDRAQKLAQMKEEEAKSLIGKVRDLENRLIIAQAKAQKTNDLQMQTKVQTLEKKVDEYKRVNQRLMESMNTQKDKSNDKEIGDLRRKIDQLDRHLTEAKRNLDKSSFRIREMQESEKKLQMDLARAVEENRNLRKSSSKPGGESGGQAA